MTDVAVTFTKLATLAIQEFICKCPTDAKGTWAAFQLNIIYCTFYI